MILNIIQSMGNYETPIYKEAWMTVLKLLDYMDYILQYTFFLLLLFQDLNSD